MTDVTDLRKLLYWKKYLKKTYFFHNGGPYNIETSPLICSANQWTDFYITGTWVMKELKERIFTGLSFSHWATWLKMESFQTTFSKKFPNRFGTSVLQNECERHLLWESPLYLLSQPGAIYLLEVNDENT